MQIVGSKLVERQGHQFFWQIREDGQHRLVFGDVEGEWAAYEEAANIPVGVETYSATTWDKEEGHTFSAKDLMRVTHIQTREQLAQVVREFELSKRKR